jgi:uncharacterized protein
MGAAAWYTVRSPRWVLTYSGINITDDISRMALEIIYTDRLGGAASEIELTLEDHDRRWQGPWYPQQGDLVNLMIGYDTVPLLPCGDFQVDELALSGPPDVLRMRCLSAYITPAMRTRNSVGYEGQTLENIAGQIARKYGLDLLSAKQSTTVAFARITQKHESDLSFLERLASENNYEFTIRGAQLVFYPRQSLESVAPVLTITRPDLLTFSFINKTHRIYQAATVSYHQPATKQLITQHALAAPVPATSDTLKIVARSEDGQQALLKAQSAVHECNMVQTTASLTLPGEASLSAGNNVSVSGFQAYDGIYMIDTARHRLSRDQGYVSEIEARRVSQ